MRDAGATPVVEPISIAALVVGAPNGPATPEFVSRSTISVPPVMLVLPVNVLVPVIHHRPSPVFASAVSRVPS